MWGLGSSSGEEVSGRSDSLGCCGNFLGGVKMEESMPLALRGRMCLWQRQRQRNVGAESDGKRGAEAVSVGSFCQTFGCQGREGARERARWGCF